jgi:hypothetical protein
MRKRLFVIHKLARSFNTPFCQARPLVKQNVAVLQSDIFSVILLTSCVSSWCQAEIVLCITVPHWLACCVCDCYTPTRHSVSWAQIKPKVNAANDTILSQFHPPPPSRVVMAPASYSECPGSDQDQQAGYSDKGVSWFSSVPPRKLRDVMTYFSDHLQIALPFEAM